MINKTILHYRILEKLGEGGMGIVYLAEDTKLERKVAIKFLPRHIAANDEERERFKIEAKAAAALNHPNIATIHAIEEANDEMFIVMEYIEGRELRDIVGAIHESPLPIDKIINYATQIASGLQAAHKKGIIHRDIKSANIMITGEGQVKIMDFGLAKIGAGAHLTRSGSTIGTVSYMSPEQVRGEALDHCTDIWALGVVLYEMLTGKTPFTGDYEQAILYAIINEDEPPVSQLRPDIPTFLEKIVTNCLQKSREDRYQDTSEILESLSGSQSNKTVPGGASKNLRRPLLWLPLLIIVTVFTVSAYMIFANRSDSDIPPTKMVRLTSFPGQEADPALSPDGRTVAFVWEGPDRKNLDIYVKLVDAGDPVRLTDNPAHEDYPRWSPDGRHIAFSRQAGPRNDEIYVIPALGGPERRIVEYRTKDDGGICWSTDGKSILFSDETEELGWRIFRVDVETSEIEQVTTVPEGEENLLDYTPRVSPDGKFLAFVRRSPATSADVYTLSFADQKITRLTSDDLPVNGLTWTPDSWFVVFNSNRDGAPGLWRVALDGGEPQKIAVSGMTLSYPDISLTGNRLVYYEYQVNENIWKVNLENPEIQRPLHMATQHKHFARISPDGSRIAYSSDRTGSYDIWVCNSNGTDHMQLTHVNDANHQAISWSPDGRYLVFSSVAMGIGNRLYVVSANGGKPRILTENAYLPGWSRDSKWIYFTTLEGMCKISVEGGEKEKLGKQPTVFIGEGWDGEFLYTSRVRKGRTFFQDLWRMPATGGEEELLVERDNYRWTFGSWVIASEGVYYIAYPTDTTRNVSFFDFGSRTSKTLFPAPEGFGGYLDVSPDEEWLIYLKNEQAESDIILIENFH